MESLQQEDNTDGKNQVPTIVVATDVAARGLDIPSVATVIHYDAARTVDTFVHRSGRTAVRHTYYKIICVFSVHTVNAKLLTCALLLMQSVVLVMVLLVVAYRLLRLEKTKCTIE